MFLSDLDSSPHQIKMIVKWMVCKIQAIFQWSTFKKCTNPVGIKGSSSHWGQENLSIVTNHLLKLKCIKEHVGCSYILVSRWATVRQASLLSIQGSSSSTFLWNSCRGKFQDCVVYLFWCSLHLNVARNDLN